VPAVHSHDVPACEQPRATRADALRTNATSQLEESGNDKNYYQILRTVVKSNSQKKSLVFRVLNVSKNFGVQNAVMK
jgi:hypothetical protein